MWGVDQQTAHDENGNHAGVVGSEANSLDGVSTTTMSTGRQTDSPDGWREGEGEGGQGGGWTEAGGRLSVSGSCVRVRCGKQNRYSEEMVENVRKVGEPHCNAESRVSRREAGMRATERRGEIGSSPGLQWKQKGRRRMRREQLLVDSCYSNVMLMLAGKERTQTQIPHIAIAALERLCTCVWGGCRSICHQRRRACAACAARMWVCVAEISRVWRTCVSGTRSARIGAACGGRGMWDVR